MRKTSNNGLHSFIHSNSVWQIHGYEQVGAYRGVDCSGRTVLACFSAGYGGYGRRDDADYSELCKYLDCRSSVDSFNILANERVHGEFSVLHDDVPILGKPVGVRRFLLLLSVWAPFSLQLGRLAMV